MGKTECLSFSLIKKGAFHSQNTDTGESIRNSLGCLDYYPKVNNIFRANVDQAI